MLVDKLSSGTIIVVIIALSTVVAVLATAVGAALIANRRRKTTIPFQIKTKLVNPIVVVLVAVILGYLMFLLSMYSTLGFDTIVIGGIALFVTSLFAALVFVLGTGVKEYSIGELRILPYVEFIIDEKNEKPYDIFRVDQRLLLENAPNYDPTIPAYTLDKNYFVVDWNLTFSLIFDNTLAGMRGESIGKWIYHLDNYKEILDHSIAVFGNVSEMPTSDTEEIRYTNFKYGRFSAIKNTTQIVDEKNVQIGWLAKFVDLQFFEDDMSRKYCTDLTEILEKKESQGQL